jgi:hypothetical protein
MKQSSRQAVTARLPEERPRGQFPRRGPPAILVTLCEATEQSPIIAKMEVQK